MSTSLKSTIQKYVILKIGSDEWIPGQNIPSENRMAIKFNCSRLTVRSALQNLVNSGILIVKKGKGYLVPNLDKSPILKSFSKRNNCNAIDTIFISKNNELENCFEWDDNDKIIGIQKTYFKNGEKIAIQITFLNKDLIWDKSSKLLNGSLTTFLSKQGSAIKRSDITVMEANENWKLVKDNMEQLHWKDTPMIEKIRTYSNDGWIEKTIRLTSKKHFKLTFTQNNYL